MITCEQLEEFLAEYFDGELTDAQGDAFEKHLRVCSDCVNYVESYRRTVELARSLGEDPTEPPATVPDELFNAILAAQQKS